MADLKRMSISIDPDVDSSISTIARLSGKSKAAVIREFLEVAKDTFATIASSLESMAALEEDQRDLLRERLNDASRAIREAEIATLSVQKDVASTRLEAAQSRSGSAPPPGGGRGSNPRSVTRGSGKNGPRTSSSKKDDRS